MDGFIKMDFIHNGLYSINEYGVIINNVTEHIKKQRLDGCGYPIININHNNIYVHRLVAKVFIGEPDGLTVNHKDFNKQNNHISNLEYLTMAENMQHARDHGKIPSATYRLIHSYKDGIKIKTYDSYAQIEKDGFRATNVSDILHGRGKTHYGHTFVGEK